MSWVVVVESVFDEDVKHQSTTTTSILRRNDTDFVLFFVIVSLISLQFRWAVADVVAFMFTDKIINN